MQHHIYLQKVTDCIYSFGNYAYSLTGNKEDASDLMHDTFIRACYYEWRYTEDINLRGWLRVMMRNIFINHYRVHHKREKATYRIGHELFDDINMSTANDGESNAGMGQIFGAMDQLDADLTTPFLLHYSGYKYREISERLAIPVGTIKSRIHQARRALQRQLSV